MYTIDVPIDQEWYDGVGLIPPDLLAWLELHIGPVLGRREGYAKAREWGLVLVYDYQDVRVFSFEVASKTDALLLKLTWR